MYEIDRSQGGSINGSKAVLIDTIKGDELGGSGDGEYQIVLMSHYVDADSKYSDGRTNKIHLLVVDNPDSSKSFPEISFDFYPDFISERLDQDGFPVISLLPNQTQGQVDINWYRAAYNKSVLPALELERSILKSEIGEVVYSVDVTQDLIDVIELVLATKEIPGTAAYGITKLYQNGLSGFAGQGVKSVLKEGVELYGLRFIGEVGDKIGEGGDVSSYFLEALFQNVPDATISLFKGKKARVQASVFKFARAASCATGVFQLNNVEEKIAALEILSLMADQYFNKTPLEWDEMVMTSGASSNSIEDIIAAYGNKLGYRNSVFSEDYDEAYVIKNFNKLKAIVEDWIKERRIAGNPYSPFKGKPISAIYSNNQLKIPSVFLPGQGSLFDTRLTLIANGGSMMFELTGVDKSTMPFYGASEYLAETGVIRIPNVAIVDQNGEIYANYSISLKFIPGSKTMFELLHYEKLH